MSTIHELRRILGGCRTLAVVGLSAQWHRPSFFAAKYMQAHGYRIVPVNPTVTEILGERSYPSVTAAAEALAEQGQRIDIVDCFRRTEEIPPLAEEAIAVGAKCLWQQIGVVNEAADARVRAAGLWSVMNRCVKIEHARLFGGLNWAGVDTRVISARRPQQLFY
ncbi:CoA-binding protein [Ramlibacter sp.]|uniref:CoA-binding protein n=1 Tax=Ramlibacter sp. TaxID=1917967 RepID=UPI0035AE35A4